MNYIIPFLCGIAIGILSLMLLTDDDILQANEYDAVIKQCQAELPRSQKCIITAVPEVAE